MAGKQRLTHLWERPGGYREVLVMAVPLVLSTGSWTIQHFVDRMFLTWYSAEAIAAAMPAALLNWSFIGLFVGTAGYVNTFVAQYHGAGQYSRIGAVVWQGMYFSFLATPLMYLALLIGEPFFLWLGHTPELARQEGLYFRILMLGAPAVVLSNALSGFFSGLGKTWTVMWVNTAATAVNIGLDYVLIFGRSCLPELGIAGAGIASDIAALVAVTLFLFRLFARTHRQAFATFRARALDTALLRRLMAYGMPTGLQFLLEVSVFTLFVLLVGRLGVVELAATNIAFNINSLAFLPMFGMTIAVSVLVGQRLGANNPRLARRTAWSAFHLALGYFTLLACGYAFLPELFLAPFGWQASNERFEPVARLATMLLKYVAIYSLFDAANMVFSGALKGAGDTRFVALANLILAVVTMALPCTLIVYFFHGNIHALWSFATLYVCALGVTYFVRFQGGRWQSMRVIETAPATE